MQTLFPLKGIVTVLNTPFNHSGDVDYEDLKAHVDLAMEAGVNGFLVPAMASEVNKLTTHERIKMVEEVLTSVNKKVPVFAGTSANSLRDSKKILRAYLEMGCEHVLFQIPYRNDSQFIRDFMELADLNPKVIMLQDWDSSGYGLPDQLIVKLFEDVEPFKCLKIETNPAGLKYTRILELTRNKLNVSGGWAVTQMIEGLKRGVHAFMPTGMHLIYTEIYNLYKSGNVQRAQELFNKVLPVLSFSNQHLDISIHFFKLLLFQKGIYKTANVRGPILSFDNIHKEIAQQLVRRIIKIENSLKEKRS